MRNEMEYELNRYDVYKSYAQLFLHQGLAREARLFESLADLCFEKAVGRGSRLFTRTKKGIERNTERSRRLQQWIPQMRLSEPFHRTNLPLLLFLNGGSMANDVQQY